MNFKSRSRARIAIIGGGIAGLSCAWTLLRRGADVCVFEKEQAGRGALWASGGMLAGGFECAEAKSDSAFVGLARRSMELWRAWADVLGPDTIGFRAGGVLAPAKSADDKDWLDTLHQRASMQGIRTDWVSDLPPGIDAVRGLHFPNDGELDNRMLGRRLVDAVRSGGGDIREHAPVQSFAPSPDGVIICDGDAAIRFDRVVVATGHDAGELATMEPALQAIRSVKGQMFSLAPGVTDLPHCLRGQNIYASQKQDRRIVIGSTSEAGRADLSVDEGVIAELRQRAESWVASLATHAELERWAGVRPSTLDGQPVFGPGREPGIYLALGLYRNGVLLAPAVAEHVADAVLTDRAVPREFGAARFDFR